MHFQFFAIKLVTSLMNITFAQTPEQVVQLQLEAYNAGDIDKFMSVFSDDIELWTLGEAQPWAKGKDAVTAIYAKLFENSPELHSEIITRTVIGNKVIDYERITGRNGGDVLYLVMIYEVRDGKIFRATAVREN
jgi:hypothetical protein